MSADLPVHAPISAGGLDSPFVRTVLGRREARRLAGLFAEAERRAEARMAAARREIEDLFAAARAEAAAILAALPDMAALEAVPAGRSRSAMAIIREEADRAGISIAAVMRRPPSALARPARDRAIAVLATHTPLKAAEIGELFGMGADRVREIARLEARR